jgi:predicted MPP superfamily phosphohydrolase
MRDALVWCGTALALLGHALLWTELVSRMHGLKGPRRIIKLLTVLSVLAFAALPAAAAWRMGSAAEGRGELFSIGGSLQAYAWACAALGAAGLLVKPWIEWLRYDRRVLAEWTGETRDVAKAVGGALLVGAYPRLLGRIPGNEATSLSIDRKRLALPRLPAELDGLTIAHLSDLHMTGRVGREFYDYVVRAVNDLRPDVIAITGDIVESEACLPWLAESLGRLCAPLGVYFILGNHDQFIDPDRTRALLMDQGLTCLSGRWVRVEWNGVGVLLGGNELPWMPAASLERLAPHRPAGSEFRLVLCHTPDQFAWCQRAEADLALAGHTHGGQVQLPVLGVVLSPSVHGSRYACGVFRRESTVLHVSRGLGGQTPLRWRCPPEIALMQLVAQP